MAEDADWLDQVREKLHGGFDSFKRYYEAAKRGYVNFMAADAFTASKVEGAIRTASYLIPGRFKAADEISELVYAAGNLLGLFNDILLKHKAKLVEVWTREQAYFMKLLTVIEYVEVFVEIASERLWGEPFKWMVVLCIHIIKSVLRYILLFKHKAGILPNPPTQPLNRERDLPNTTFTSVTSESSSSSSSGVWKAERSGKFVQSLGSSNGNERAWQRRHQPLSVTSQPPTALKLDQTAGEALYIARPLAHFPSMFVFGEKSWKPWILSLSMDLASIALLSRGKNYNYAELSELKRRKWMLLFYILRSPFYDRYSKLRILGLLGWLCRVLPWFSMFIQPIVDYLPMWQRTYFYNWAS